MKRTGSIGVDYVRSIVNKQFGWIFREQLSDDYGIDAYIEIADDIAPIGKLIAVQIKSGQSYFAKQNKNGIVFNFDSRHAEYWSRHSLPVIIVLYNPSTNKCIWSLLQQQSIKSTSGKGYTTIIPWDNDFDISAKAMLEKIADNQSPFEIRYNGLLEAKMLMEEIQKGNTLVLEAEEWINKSSGRGSMQLLLVDPLTCEETSLVEWPFVMFPMQLYRDVFPKLFPWADFSVDEDFYYEQETWRYQDEECHYDSEDGIYYPVGLSRRDWNALQPKIRPYSNTAGEVDSYRLVLTLNDIGSAFLILESFLTQKQL